MTGLFLSFTPIHTLRGKAATAAGGRERERLCGGERRAPSSAAGRHLPQRSVGVRHKVLGAHAETQGIPTGCGALGGVTERKDAR